jgi:hypothetical protein
MDDIQEKRRKALNNAEFQPDPRASVETQQINALNYIAAQMYEIRRLLEKERG